MTSVQASTARRVRRVEIPKPDGRKRPLGIRTVRDRVCQQAARIVAYHRLRSAMCAALPFVDRFVPAHNLASLESLAAVLAGIERRHAA